VHTEVCEGEGLLAGGSWGARGEGVVQEGVCGREEGGLRVATKEGVGLRTPVEDVSVGEGGTRPVKV